MSDFADNAAEISGKYLSGSIAKALANRPSATTLVSSPKICQECGARIPEARRQAMPGCELCLDCQTWVEKRGNFWP